MRGIGIGVPAPVAFSRGEPVAPPMMPGWDGFSIPGGAALGRQVIEHVLAPETVDGAIQAYMSAGARRRQPSH